MDQLNDPLYKNWLKAGLGLKYLKKGLENFVSSEIQITFANINGNVSQLLSSSSSLDCSKQTYFTQSTKSPPKYFCSYDNSYDKNQCDKNCPNLVCSKLVEEIAKFHRHGKPIWSNTDPCFWTSDAWEIAKCFLSVDGYSHTRNAADTDCSGLLSIMINMKHIGTILNISDSDFRTGSDVLTKVIL